MKINIRRISYKFISSVLCLSVMTGMFGIVSYAYNDDDTTSSLVSQGFVAKSTEDDKALDYTLESAELVFDASGSIGADCEDCTDMEGKSYNSVYIDNQEDVATYKLTTKKTGYYNISITYLLDKNQGNDLALAFKLDGKKILEENSNIVLPRLWCDDGDKRTDVRDNEIAPKQKSAEKIITARFITEDSANEEELLVYLESGIHTISIFNCSQKVNIIKLEALAPEEILPYDKVKEDYKNYNDYSGKAIIIQGEDAIYKTSRSLIAKCDRSSPNLTPSSATKDVLNYMGGTSWQENGDEIIWQVNVPATGLYKLGFTYLQNTVINGISYRHLKINGKTPFEEAKYLKFEYDTSWNYTGFFDDEGNPYLIYLEEGLQEISLSVTLGKIRDSYNAMNEIISNLGDLYINITIITGETPDANRDYDLFKKVVDWDNRLLNNIEKLGALAEQLKALSGEDGSTMIAAVENMSRVLNNMKDNPYTAQIYINDFYSCYTTLSSWLFEMKRMPLGIDNLELYAPNAEYAPKKVSFFEKFAFGFKRFLISFTDDYGAISNENQEGKSLKIWVNWGRDQAMVLNNLIQESFTEYSEKELGYKVTVNVELVNASLVKGILSNNAPDLALQLSRTEPVNLAMRGALVDLSSFEDFESVLSRFGSSGTLPYQYNGKTYALPDQQTFYLMFYRKDILEQLGIAVPNTWDEFLAATAVLQRNNMNSYIPYTQITSETTVNTGVGNLNLYPTILQQFGGSFYNDKLNKTTFDTSTSVSAFKYWVDMYTLYKIPTDADFYNRFRLGTMPLGVTTYTLYNTLAQAAPEINGRWGIALVPGIVNNETNEIDRTISGGGTGCSILSASKNKEEAWAFLKWWTEAQTQLDYNNNVESIIGATARVPLATVEAFKNLSWKPADVPVLSEQFSKIKEINEVPGSYYVSRAVDQAFWNVVTNGKNHKDVLIEWGSIANNEISRKISEYN